MRPSFNVEKSFLKQGLWPVAGVDEAGRGPLAGPVAAAAVILDPTDLPRGLDDSKALTAAERERLYGPIMAKAIAVSVAFASAADIDATDIRLATHAAMCRAIHGLAVRPVAVLVDGREVPDGLPCEAQAIVKGDASSKSIAAASIVAKVTRDRLMTRLALAYPAYGFDLHKGYATLVHTRCIAAHGPSPYHRMSFSPFVGAVQEA
jgi:ribonuclease HII